MKVQGRTKYHFRKQFRVFSWSYSNRDLFLTLWLWIFIVSHQHKGLSSQQEQNRGSPSIWDPMSFRESVVNMVSKAEKFKYKPTVLTVGRKKNTVAWLYLSKQLVEDQNQYHYPSAYYYSDISETHSTFMWHTQTKINLEVIRHCFREAYSWISV